VGQSSVCKTTELFSTAKIVIGDPADVKAISEIQTSNQQWIISITDDPSWIFNAWYFYNAY